MPFGDPAPTAKVRQRLEVKENASLALKMRLGGKPAHEIADALGLSVRRVRELIAQELASTTTVDVDNYRSLELQRLEDLWEEIRPFLMHNVSIGQDAEGQEVTGSRPDMRVVDRLIRLSERRSKLLGMDMPTKLEIKGANGPTVIDIVEFDPAIDAPPGRIAASPGAGVEE